MLDKDMFDQSHGPGAGYGNQGRASAVGDCRAGGGVCAQVSLWAQQ